MKTIEFAGAKPYGDTTIVVSRIEAYGMNAISYDENDEPVTAVVWIQVGTIMYNNDYKWENACKMHDRIEAAVNNHD